MTRTLLIDGDVLAYKVASSIERENNWGDGIWTLHSDESEGIEKVNNNIAHLMDTLVANDVVIALTSPDNFRYKVWPPYKSNRKDKRKPLCLSAMREYMQNEYEVFERPGLEGDDVLGILATHPKLIPGDKIIVSVDKDMKTIPGLYYNDGKPDEGIVTISEAEADYWFLYQTLTGDSTDGYPGIPGIGPKKAEAILEKDCSWASVVTAYEKAGLTEDDAIVQARCARILRHTDYDFKKKKVILWNPSATSAG